MEEGPDAVLAVLGGDAERVPFDLEAPTADALAAGLPRLADAVAARGEPPFALLGECTLAPAVTGGLRRRHPDLALVWIDAHGDLNTPATSPSGFLGGMPFAVALGWCHDGLRRAASLEPALPVTRAALVGARDLDPGEAESIAREGLASVATVEEALAALPPDAPLHVHVDGDVLDPADAPGVDFPAPDGWRLDHLQAQLQLLADTGRVVGTSLCCGNPRRDPEGRGARSYAAALAPSSDARQKYGWPPPQTPAGRSVAAGHRAHSSPHQARPRR